MQTTLTEAQELVIVEVRKLLLLPLDDLLVLARTFLNPNLSRSALDRCLRRHGVSNLRALQKKRESIKQRRYLFVAIDRATRWVYLEIHEDKSAESATRFLAKVLANAPFVVRTVLTDNGKEFSDRFSSAGERQPTGRQPFDRLCGEKRITHRLIQPRHPQTNGMVERFNGCITEILRSERFVSAADLQETLTRYLWAYNHRIPQRALGHMTPIEKLRWWQTERPELFVSRVDNVTGLDMLMSSARWRHSRAKQAPFAANARTPIAPIASTVGSWG
uniref:Transposase n=1 Tax=uncultured beta proteobacterium TaxID=86027 RepID=H5SF11_9PROT|nr:transposase [uncultured beta proteobacterium]